VSHCRPFDFRKKQREGEEEAEAEEEEKKSTFVTRLSHMA
jgi:hypothetical protein